jgi:PhnB protein
VNTPSPGFKTTVTATLSVRDWERAVEFYKAAFGASELYRGEGGGVAQLAVGGAQFWVAEESPEHRNYSPQSLGGCSVRMLLVVDDPAAVCARAVAAGASQVAPVADAHGWRIGRIVDPAGHHWEIARPLSADAGCGRKSLAAEHWQDASGTSHAGAPLPLSFAERFRNWYEYERDCNAKSLKMLESVPGEARASPSFARAVGKMAHLVAARQMWLFRLGVVADRPEGWFPATALEELPAAAEAVEGLWTAYLARLTDADLAADVTLTGGDGRRYRWRLADLLTQLFGHAWYHRGQIAMMVKDLGGEAVDTDYIFWNRPTAIEE